MFLTCAFRLLPEENQWELYRTSTLNGCVPPSSCIDRAAAGLRLLALRAPSLLILSIFHKRPGKGQEASMIRVDVQKRTHKVHICAWNHGPFQTSSASNQGSWRKEMAPLASKPMGPSCGPLFKSLVVRAPSDHSRSLGWLGLRVLEKPYKIHHFKGEGTYSERLCA